MPDNPLHSVQTDFADMEKLQINVTSSLGLIPRSE